MKKLLCGASALCFLLPVSLRAAPDPVVWHSVAVCDPNAPTHCAKPDASGNLPVTGGGGGGGGAVYGPTANGSPAANPPVLMGGTANGTATGNVGNWKVDSGGLGYVSVGAALPAGANTIGAVTQASGPWTVSWSGQTVAATQSGTWTVQPGNTANTTPWLTTISQGGNSATVSAGGALKVDGSAATQPVSGSVSLNAGSNIVGKVGIDQTTPGTTNNVTMDAVSDGATFSNTGVTSATTLVTLNTAGYGYLEFQTPSVGSGNVIAVEASCDGTPGTGSTFVGSQFWRQDAGTGVPNTVATPLTTVNYVAAVTCPTMRIRVSTYSSGTISLFGALKRGAVPLPPITQVSLALQGSISSSAAGASATATQLITAGYSRLYNGSTWDPARSGSGAASINTGIGSASVEEGGRPYTHISTNATTTAKSGAGFLHAICINTKGASSNTATVYDNTTGSGTVIAVIDTTAQTGCLTYDAAFGTGLTVVTATGTAPDLTVMVR